ncbi:MAG TPA: hypothetical protein VMH92_07265, partial [Acidocella sp.]|nr:hypothetical protein [Acidocella sp.]
MKKNWWLFVAAAGVISVIAYASGSASWVHILMGDPVWPLNCPGCSWHKSFHYEVTLEQPWTVSSVVWSSDGKYLAVGSAGGGIINVYDTANWQLIDGIWRWDIGGFEPLTRFTDQNTTLIFPRLWGMNAKIRTPGSMADENVSIEKWN